MASSLSSSSREEMYNELNKILASTLAKGAPLTSSSSASNMDDDMTKQQFRADPGKIRFADLEVGDRVSWTKRPGETGVITGSTSSYWDIQWPDGSVGQWTRSREQCKGHGVMLVAAVAPPTKVDFDKVILADHKKEQILEALAQVDNHDLIFNQWGFGEIFEKGTAISLLFYGPPGTGKTLMGQAIADRFGYDLKIISTAEIETPEPGGAERNLQEAFKKASNGKTVLLFDECDSLIHDRRYVGMILGAQINALLTELEHHKGIVIFTTNRLENLDEAFDRRVSLKLEFSMPEYAERIQIWKRMFPNKAPLHEDVRFEDLARIEIAGGHIKNVVIKAARKAAISDAKQITDEILWHCLEAEVESKEAFTDALENGPKYGRPMIQGTRLARIPGKVQISS